MPEDELMAMCELSNDLFFYKMPPSQYLYYIKNSLEIGRQAALTFHNEKIEDLYRRYNINVQIKEQGKAVFGLLLRGQAVWNEKGCNVEIYKTSLDALADSNKNQLNRQTAVQIHLAHEFFHFLEFRDKNEVPAQLDPIETFRFGKFRRNTRVARCSEIAAHKFTKELLNLPVLPNYYDYQYLIGIGALSEMSFADQLRNWRTQLNL